ncbi:hypothetical protein TB1_042401 [Malus domestica]
MTSSKFKLLGFVLKWVRVHLEKHGESASFCSGCLDVWTVTLNPETFVKPVKPVVDNIAYFYCSPDCAV